MVHDNIVNVWKHMAIYLKCMYLLIYLFISQCNNIKWSRGVILISRAGLEGLSELPVLSKTKSLTLWISYMVICSACMVNRLGSSFYTNNLLLPGIRLEFHVTTMWGLLNKFPITIDGRWERYKGKIKNTVHSILFITLCVHYGWV